MVAGVKPEDLELSIARDVITLKGKREENRTIDEENYFTKELYWGKFSRTFRFPPKWNRKKWKPRERHGLITIKIKKVDKEKKNIVRVNQFSTKIKITSNGDFYFWCLGGESHTRPLPLQGNALLLSYPGSF